jgi:hypothetical protein
MRCLNVTAVFDSNRDLPPPVGRLTMFLYVEVPAVDFRRRRSTYGNDAIRNRRLHIFNV